MINESAVIELIFEKKCTPLSVRRGAGPACLPGRGEALQMILMFSKNLKEATLLLLAVLLMVTAHAQKNKLPPFQVMQAGGKFFKAEQLPFGRPIVLIYFAPGCDHCEKLMNSFIKNKNTFSHASVAMITYYPVASVKDFIKQFGLQKYSNVYVGTEGNSFFIKKYYNLTTLPFMALYTQNGDLVQKYYSEKDMDTLIRQLKNLKS